MEKRFRDLTDEESKESLLFLVHYIEGLALHESKNDPITGRELKLGLKLSLIAGAMGGDTE